MKNPFNKLKKGLAVFLVTNAYHDEAGEGSMGVIVKSNPDANVYSVAFNNITLEVRADEIRLTTKEEIRFGQFLNS